MGFHECNMLNITLNFIQHLSIVIFKEERTRCFTAEDKQRLKENWVGLISHNVATINVFLFFVRRGYLRITNTYIKSKLKIEWNIGLVSKAIQE